MSMSNLKTTLYETFTGIANMVQGPLSTSKFLQEGVLTPEEVRPNRLLDVPSYALLQFVATGDLLVQKCPSWSWYVACAFFACASSDLRSVGKNPKIHRKACPKRNSFCLHTTVHIAGVFVHNFTEC